MAFENYQLYRVAQESWQKGDVTSALSKLERVLQLERQAPERSMELLQSLIHPAGLIAHAAEVAEHGDRGSVVVQYFGQFQTILIKFSGFLGIAALLTDNRQVKQNVKTALSGGG